MFKITLKGIILEVYLGIHDFEQSSTQSIRVDINFSFLSLPLGCVSDNIDEVICYDNIVKALRGFVVDKKYKLIEHLGYELLSFLKNIISLPVDICLHVNKYLFSNYVDSVIFSISSKWKQ